jgi:hypothetical protein
MPAPDFDALIAETTTHIQSMPAPVEKVDIGRKAMCAIGLKQLQDRKEAVAAGKPDPLANIMATVPSATRVVRA